MSGTMHPIYKFNSGQGATLCCRCGIIMSTGKRTNKLYCKTCKLVMFMRPIARIPIFLEKMDLSKIFNILFPEIKSKYVETIANDIRSRIEELKEYWLNHPDQRFTQVLVNTGMISNTPGMWYYEEDEDLLIKSGYEAREVVLWGRNFDKDMKKLSETEWIPIKDLKTDHIKAIISGNYTRHPRYLKLFEEELELRKST